MYHFLKLIMNNFPTWYFLTGIVVVGLIVFYKKGAAWGGLFIGVVVGCVISIIHNDKGQGFEFIYVKEAAIIGALAGIVIAFISRLINKSRNKPALSSNVHPK